MADSALFDLIEQGGTIDPSKLGDAERDADRVDPERRSAPPKLREVMARSASTGILSQPYEDTPVRQRTPAEADNRPKNRYGKPIDVDDTPLPTARDTFGEGEQQDPYEKAGSAAIRKERLQKQGTRWYDYPLEAAAGVGDILTGAGALGKYAGDTGPASDVLSGVGKFISGTAEGLQSEAYKYVREEEEFWDWNRPGAKITGMVFRSIPSLLASGGVGGVVGRGVVGGTRFLAGEAAAGAVARSGVPGMMGAGAAGGAMNAGDVAEQISEDIMKAPEQTLREASKYYQNLRQQGKSDAEARAELVKEAQGWKPIAAGMVGALSAFGIDGTVANIFAGKLAATSFTKGALKGMSTEAAQEFVENASNEFLAQKAKIEQGLQKGFDYNKVWQSGASGALVGAIMGGGIGGFARERPHVVPHTTADPDNQAAIAATYPALPAPPPPPPPAGPPGGLPAPGVPPGLPSAGAAPLALPAPQPGAEVQEPGAQVLAPATPPQPSGRLPAGEEPIYAGAQMPTQPAFQTGLDMLLETARGGPEGDFTTTQGVPGQPLPEPTNPDFIMQLARGLWTQAGGDPSKYMRLVRQEQERITESEAEPKIYAHQQQTREKAERTLDDALEDMPRRIAEGLRVRGVTLQGEAVAEVERGLRRVESRAKTADDVEKFIAKTINFYSTPTERKSVPFTITSAPTQRPAPPALKRSAPPLRGEAREYPTLEFTPLTAEEQAAQDKQEADAKAAAEAAEAKAAEEAKTKAEKAITVGRTRKEMAKEKAQKAGVAAARAGETETPSGPLASTAMIAPGEAHAAGTQPRQTIPKGKYKARPWPKDYANWKTDDQQAWQDLVQEERQAQEAGPRAKIVAKMRQLEKEIAARRVQEDRAAYEEKRRLEEGGAPKPREPKKVAKAPVYKEKEAEKVEEKEEKFEPGFTTAKGSTYIVHEDGSTTRTKAARKDVGHEGDKGLKPKSLKTVYLTKKDADRLAQPKGEWAFVVHNDGTISLVWPNAKTGRWAPSETSRAVPFSTEPAVGLTPLELWKFEGVTGNFKGFKNAHFGNAITEIKQRPAKVETPVDTQAKERQTIYKALANRGVEIDDELAGEIREAVAGIQTTDPKARNVAVQQLINQFEDLQYERQTELIATFPREESRVGVKPGYPGQVIPDISGMTWAEIKAYANETLDKAEEERKKAIEKPPEAEGVVPRGTTPEEQKANQQKRREMADTWVPPSKWSKDLKTLVYLVQYMGGKVNKAVALKIGADLNEAHEKNKSLRGVDLSKNEALRQGFLNALEKERVRLEGQIDEGLDSPGQRNINERLAQIASLTKEMQAAPATMSRFATLWGMKLPAYLRTPEIEAYIKAAHEKQFTRDMHAILEKYGADEGRRAARQYDYENKGKFNRLPTLVQDRLFSRRMANRRQRRAEIDLVKEALQRPEPQQAVDHLASVLRAEFNMRFLDNPYVTTDHINRVVEREIKKRRAEIARAVENNTKLRPARPELHEAIIAGRPKPPMKDAKRQYDIDQSGRVVPRKDVPTVHATPTYREEMEHDIAAAIQKIANERAEAGKVTTETEQHEKVVAGTAPAGTQATELTKDVRKGFMVMLADEIRQRRGAQERKTKRKGVTPRGILKADDQTFRRWVDEEMRQPEPQAWAVAASELYAEQGKLSSAKRHRERKGQIREQLNAIRIGRARAIHALEQTLGKKGGLNKLRIQRAVAQYVQGVDYDIEGLLAEPEGKPATPLEAELRRLRNLKAAPTEVEAAQAAERIKASDPATMQHEINEGQKNIVQAALALFKPKGMTLAITTLSDVRADRRAEKEQREKEEKTQNIRAIRKKIDAIKGAAAEQRSPTATGRFFKEETDEQAVARWTKLIEAVNAALKKNDKLSQIGDSLEVGNSAEMNLMVMMKRAVKKPLYHRFKYSGEQARTTEQFDIADPTYAPTGQSSFVQNVRGLEARYRLAKNDDELQGVVDDIQNAIRDVSTTLRRIPGQSTTEEAWGNYIDRAGESLIEDGVPDFEERIRAEGESIRALGAAIRESTRKSEEVTDTVAAMQQAQANQKALLDQLAETADRLGVPRPVMRETVHGTNQIVIYKKKDAPPTVLPGLGAPTAARMASTLSMTGQNLSPAWPTPTQINPLTRQPERLVTKTYEYPMVGPEEMGPPRTSITDIDHPAHVAALAMQRATFEQPTTTREEDLAAARAAQQKRSDEFIRDLNRRNREARKAAQAAEQARKDEAARRNKATLARGFSTKLEPMKLDGMLSGILDFDPKTGKAAPVEEGSYRAQDLLDRATRQMKKAGFMEGFFPQGLGGGLKFIRNALTGRLNTLVGDLEVVITNDMPTETNEQGEEEYIHAVFFPRGYGGRQRPQIMIHQGLFNMLPPARQMWMLQHEMTHGATTVAYKMNLNGARPIFDALYAEAKRSSIGSDPRFWYAMTSAEEFIAEVRSNGNLQEAMYNMTSPGPRGMPMQMNMWRRFVQAVQNTLGLAFGGRPAENYLSHVLAATETAMMSDEQQLGGMMSKALKEKLANPQPLPGTSSEEDPLGVEPMFLTIDNIAAGARARAGDAVEALSDQGFWGKVKSTAIGFEGGLALGRWSKQGKLFTREDGSDAFYDWVKEYEKIGDLIDTVQQTGSLLAAQLNKFIRTVRDAARAVDILYNASLWGYDPRYDLNHRANAHLTEEEVVELMVGGVATQIRTGRWATPAQQAAAAQSHARDNADWNALHPQTQEMMSKVVDHYQAMQKLLAGVIAKNIIEADIASGEIMTPRGVNRDVFIAYAISGRMTVPDANKTAEERRLDDLLGASLPRLKAAMQIATHRGIYIPFTRDGDYVVRGRIKVPTPTGAHRADPDQQNTYIFATESAAVQYAKRLQQAGIYNSLQRRHFDASGARVSRATATSTTEFAVIAQDRHVEFFDSHAEAQEFVNEARASGDFHEVKNTELVGDKFGLLKEIRPAHIATMYKSIEQNDHHSPATKAALTRALDEMQLRAMSGYRIQKHRLRRRNTRGFDKDLAKTLYRYNASMAQHLAQTARAPELAEREAEVLAMQDARNEPGTPAQALARQRLIHEFRQRLAMPVSAGPELLNKIKAVSYMNWLASTGASILNSTQVMAVTAPALYGKYDAAPVMRSLSNAYREVGALSTFRGVWAGTMGQIGNWDGEENAPNPVGLIMDRVAPRYRRLLRQAQQENKLSRFAGIEFDQFSDQGTFGKAISYAARIATVLPQAIEAINRSVTLIATYDLAMQAGKSEQEAIAEAIDMVDQTQIDMTRRGRGRHFSNPYLSLPLQFKQFSVAMVSFWARNLSAIVSKNATPQEKREARRTLIAMSMMTVALSGLSGLPWDLARAMVTAAFMLGAEDDWDSYETGTQRFLTGLMGGDAAEVLMRGIPRILGVEVSNRIGYDAMILGQLPRERTTAAMNTWIAQQVFGAPGAMAGNAFQAAQAAFAGKWGEAAEKFPAPKFANDLIRSMRGYAEGKESPTGLPLQTEYTPIEAVIRALGFAPSREALSWEVGTAAKYKDTKKANKRLGELKNEWARAETTAAKQAAWEKIKALNEANEDTRDYNPANMGDLYKYKLGLAKRRQERMEELREDEEELAED